MKPYRLIPLPSDAQPARRLKEGRYGTQIVHFPSLKNGRAVVCESPLEADFALHLEFDRSVIAYEPQPSTITVEVGQQLRRYTADFRATYHVAPPKYWEVKPDSVLENVPLLRLFSAVHAHHAKRGTRFEVICSQDIRRGPCLDNMKRLYAKAHVVAPRAIELLRDRLQPGRGPQRWADLSAGQTRLPVGALARLILSGEATMDFDVPFGPCSTIWSGKDCA